MPSDAPLDPIENWFDFRLQLMWAYDGSVGIYRKHEYLDHPISAWLVRQGSVTLHFPSGVHKFQAGHWVFPQAEYGRQEFSEDARILSVRFAAEWPTGEYLYDRTQSRAVPLSQCGELTRIAERLVRHVGQYSPGVAVHFRRIPGSPKAYFTLQRLLQGWMLAYSAVMEKIGLRPKMIQSLDTRVRDALHVMEMRPLNTPIRERELAELVGISASQLNKLFIKNMGRTPAEIWETKRMQIARLALLNSERDIKSISYDLGFSSLPHFSAWVKKKFGASPRSLRMQAKV